MASEVNESAEVRRLHRLVTEAALAHIREAEGVPHKVRDAVLQQYESRLDYRTQVLDLVDGDASDAHIGQQLRRLLATATEAEREAVLEARRTGQVEARALRYGPERY